MSEEKEHMAIHANELVSQAQEACGKLEGKYAISAYNAKRLSKIYDFFCEIVDNDGGEIECCVRTEAAYAGVIIEMSSLDLYKDTIKEFIDILQYVDLLCVKATEDGSILMNIGANHIWEVAE